MYEIANCSGEKIENRFRDQNKLIILDEIFLQTNKMSE